jgi:hypothetical protein
MGYPRMASASVLGMRERYFWSNNSTRTKRKRQSSDQESVHDIPLLWTIDVNDPQQIALKSNTLPDSAMYRFYHF